MSFIKKHLKKVWNVTKKVVKSKVFKYIVIAAAIFFTAGVAAGGFAAFAAAGPGIGGFFGAVGATMATGASAMAGAVGLTGLSTSLASYGGAAATAAGLVGAPGVAAAAGATLGTLAPISVTATHIAAGGTIAAHTAAGAGYLGAAAAATNAMNPATAQVIATGVSGAFTAMASGSQKQKYPNSYVAGGLARGGGPEAPPAYHYSVGEDAATGGEAPQPGLPGAPEDPSVAAQQASQSSAPQIADYSAGQAVQTPDTIARIRSRIQQPTNMTPAPATESIGYPLAQEQQQQDGFNLAPFNTRPTQLNVGGLIPRRT